MPCKHIFFDIDNTLFPTSRFQEMANENAINAMISKGLECDFKRGMAELQKIIKEKGSNYTRHFDLLVKRINGKKDLKIVAAGIMAYHNTKNSMAPYPEVPGVLMRLRDGGYCLHIASEGVEIKQWDKLLRLGLDMYFDNVHVTRVKGRKFYDKIVKGERARPKDCVMVGDRPDKDLKPAMQAGMYTVRMRRGKYAKMNGKADKEIRSLRELPDIIKKI